MRGVTLQWTKSSLIKAVSGKEGRILKDLLKSHSPKAEDYFGIKKRKPQPPAVLVGIVVSENNN